MVRNSSENHKDLNLLESLKQLEIDFNESFNAFEREGKKIKKSRVSIKKIRTYYRLIEFLFPEEFSYDKFNKKIKPFFSVAGSMRDLQLQLKYFKSDSIYKTYPLIEYIEHLEHQILLQEDLIKEINVSEIKTYINKDLQLIIEKITPFEEEYLSYKTAHYLSTQEDLYKELLHKIEVEDDIHEVRKLLKHVFFMSETFSLSIFNKSLDKQKLKLKQIGTWNDLVVKIEMLDHFVLDQIDHLENLSHYSRFLTREKNKANNLILKVFGESVLSKYFKS